MKRPALYALLLSTLACGGSSPPPATGGAPPSGTTATTKAAAAQPCTSYDISSAEKPPAAGWKLVGHVRAQHKGGAPVRVEARDASDKVLGSHDLATATDFKAAFPNAVCEAGGVLISINAASPKESEVKDGAMLFDVWAPEKEDETHDLEALCGPPSEPPDPKLAANMAGAHMRSRTLTSKRWRTWQGATERSYDEATDDAARKSGARAAGAKLAEGAKAAGLKSCVLADALQSAK